MLSYVTGQSTASQAMMLEYTTNWNITSLIANNPARLEYYRMIPLATTLASIRKTGRYKLKIAGLYV
jgi:hypothetical protein